MRFTATLGSLAVAALAGQTAAKAPVVSNNPAGVTYKATVDGDVQASITATSGIDGHGVLFKVLFDNLPEDEGPFGYHIHAKPVPVNGSCTATGAHQNPYNASLTCDKTDLSTCEIGDLSGKHGRAKGSKFEATYVDLYASMNPNDVAFFGSLSFVIHRNDSSRLACANFEKVASAGGNCSAPHTTIVPSATSTSLGTASPTGTSAGNTSPIPTGAASRSAASISGLAFIGLIFAWMI